MIKKIFISFFVIAVIGIGWSVARILLETDEETSSDESVTSYADFNETSNPDVNNLPPSSISKTDLSVGVVVLKSKNNSLVTSRGNFTSADVTTLDEGFSQLFGEGKIETDESFGIYYDEPSSKITVYLYKEPLSTARRSATSLLLEKLNMTNEELCGLDIPVQTNEYVSEKYAGYTDLGLEFCPGSVILE